MSGFEIGGPSCPLVVNAFAARNRLKSLGLYDEVAGTFETALLARRVCEANCSTMCGAVEATASPLLGIEGLTLNGLAEAFGSVSRIGIGCDALHDEGEVA